MFYICTGGGSKPPTGTRTVPIRRGPPSNRDERPSSGDETLPSGWTPRKAAEAAGGRGRREGTPGSGDETLPSGWTPRKAAEAAGGRGRQEGKGESQQDCLARVHAELEVFMVAKSN
jgi:hypothetical protein